MTAMKAMLDRASGKGKNIVHRMEREMLNATQRGALIRGRHIVYMLLDSLRSFDNSDMCYGYDHLMTITLHGSDLEWFVRQWEHVIDNLQGGVPAGTNLRDAFYRKIKDCAILSHDIREYERLPEGDGNKPMTGCFVVCSW